MAILLTGGAGYIGSHTAVELMRAGYEIVIADDLSNSCREVISRIEELGGGKVKFYQIDVCSREELEKLFNENEITACIHFAGKKAVPESVAKPLLYYRNNLDATINLMEVMQKYGANTLVFSSSATVYGVPKSVPINENAPLWCTNPYGWTKYMSEQIMRDACVADDKLSVMLLRYFNPIGAHESGRIGEDPEGIPNNLMPYISQVAVGRREKLVVYGNDYNTPDGTGVRDYIHVVDLAKGHLAALRYAENHKGCTAVNLGTGIGYSVLDIVRAFELANGLTIPYTIGPRRPGDVDTMYADPSLAMELLGWKAEKNIEQMCKDTWRWQSSNPKGYREG
ncbi:MAG: UDP-glucose 4-epimerase GalE [Christensenellaceae bacterium]|nr:UDP-glucose 4-epimerase GalE [Christensenellaceae bacterium]